MRRRRVLVGLAALVAGAGCTGAGAGDGSGDDTPTPTATETPTPTETPSATPMTPTLVDRTLAPRDDCPDPAVEFVADGADGTDADAPAVVVRGCVTGRNGCAEARLVDAAYDSAADRLSVVVGAVVERDPDAVCTQALTPRGYEATLAFEGGLPGAATVVHDDVDGRRTAVEATR